MEFLAGYPLPRIVVHETRARNLQQQKNELITLIHLDFFLSSLSCSKLKECLSLDANAFSAPFGYSIRF